SSLTSLGCVAMEIDRARGVPGAWASRGAIASLVLAYVSEVFSRDLGVDALVLGGYVLAAVIFAVSDRSTGGDESGAAVRLRAGAGLRSRATSLATAGVLAAIGIDILAYRVIYDSLRPARASVL